MDEVSQSAGSASRVAVAMSVLNRLDMTESCLRTLLNDPQRPAYEIAIVDNHSTDGTPAVLLEFAEKVRALGRGDSVRILTNPATTCLAAAWNQAIRATTEPWVVVLSNDVLLPPGWWKGLAAGIDRHGLALASPYPFEGKLPEDFAGWAQDFMARNHGRFWRDYSFVVYAFRRATFDQVGPLDENFQVGGFEDTDYIFRMRKLGLRYGIVGASTLYHFGSATMQAFKDQGDLHAAPNRRYFIEKWKVDPSAEQTSARAKWTRRWRRWKLKFGYM